MKSVKILAICGSHRKRKTDEALSWLMDAAAQAGAETETVLLRELDIGVCLGESSCEASRECILKDDMQQLFEKVMGADVLVFATPNYFNNMSSLMKIFVDRTNFFWEDLRKKGDKKGVIIVVGEQNLDSQEACAGTIREYFKICRIAEIGAVLCDKGNITSRKAEIETLGRTIASI